MLAASFLVSIVFSIFSANTLWPLFGVHITLFRFMRLSQSLSDLLFSWFTFASAQVVATKEPRMYRPPGNLTRAVGLKLRCFLWNAASCLRVRLYVSRVFVVRRFERENRFPRGT